MESILNGLEVVNIYVAMVAAIVAYVASLVTYVVVWWTMGYLALVGIFRILRVFWKAVVR